MVNYIFVNGKKTELTTERLRELGFIRDSHTAAELSEIVRSGKARERFSIRDSIHMSGYEFTIIGFDHEKVVDLDRTVLHSITLMGKILLPARRMHDGPLQRGWIDAELRKWLNEELVKELPEELNAHICTVEKITHNAAGEAFKTGDRLFIPSESELFGSAIWAAGEDGARYEAFSTRQDRILFDENGESDWYWSRSSVGGISTNCAYVATYGLASGSTPINTSIRLPLCFCFA